MSVCIHETIDWAEAAYDTDEKDDSKKDKIAPIKIDFENIYQRIVQVTRLPGNEGDLAISQDGETFFFSGMEKT